MDFYKTILYITAQLVILYLYLVYTTEKYSKSSIETPKKILVLFSCMGLIILKELLSSYSVIFTYIICFMTLILIEKYILNYSNNSMILSNLIFCTCISLSIISSYTISKILCNSLLVNSISSENSILLYSILKCITFSVLIGTITLFLSSKDTKIVDIIEDLKFKELLSAVSCMGILIISTVVTLYLQMKITDIAILSFNFIQMTLISSLIFIYFKYVHFYTYTQEELAKSELYNKTLSETNDRLRLLKHDYNNILQSINGYIITKQYDELDMHVKKLISNSREISNLECISPKIINQPAIYGVVGEKYFTAQSKNITFNIDVFTDISSISFDFTKLSRILGILLDNAIEAAEKSENPSIDLKFSYSEARKSHIIEIKNTFEKGKKIDTTKIFEKGESSKMRKSGLGLWEVKKIISSCKNASICASVTSNNDFVQTLLASA